MGRLRQMQSIKARLQRGPLTMEGTKVSLIGHDEPTINPREFIGHLTGLVKSGNECEFWQVYWTKVPVGPDNIKEFVRSDRLIIIGHNVKGR